MGLQYITLQNFSEGLSVVLIPLLVIKPIANGISESSVCHGEEVRSCPASLADVAKEKGISQTPDIVITRISLNVK